MPTVLICPTLLQNNPGEHSRILEAAGFAIRYPVPPKPLLTESDLLANIDGVDAALAGPEPYTPAVLARGRQLRSICRAGVGYDAVDVAAATKAGIAVGITPGTNHDAVAEHTFALMLAAAKRIVEGHQGVVAGRFQRKVMKPLRGHTLGIVGFGRIGRAVALRAVAFGMRVLVHDPVVTPTAADKDYQWVALDELFGRSDYVSLHAPLMPETSHLIDERSLRQMKDGAVLINTARGGLVDERALADALRTGKIAVAALDVFESEPPVGSPMLEAPNVVLSAHVAGIDADSLAQMAVMAAQTIVDLFQGRFPSERLVNAADLGANWRWGNHSSV